MRFFLLDELSRDPLYAMLVLAAFVGALLSALTIHEAGHAFVAHRLGDQTARSLGRLSLNPLRHLDPMGTLMFVFVGFGWGKPVPVNADNLQHGRRGLGLVSLAGPGSNFLLAALTGLAIRVFSLDVGQGLFSFDMSSLGSWVGMFVGAMIWFNLILGVFNLIPLAPLDGSKVAIGFAPPAVAESLIRFERYGPVVLMGVIGADLFFRVGLLTKVLLPPVQFFSRILLGDGFI
ncbi:MAG: site-2 protease family protein [Chloroflexi bacterium]|nr:site-2 protease family protein [Chloroflexota bacterium]